MTNQQNIFRKLLDGRNPQCVANRGLSLGKRVGGTLGLLVLGVCLSGCQDFYRDVYSYRRSYFVPYERIESERLAEERAKLEAEKAKDAATRMAAEGLMNAPAAAPMQQGGGGVGAIPGLDPIPGL